MNSQTAHKKLVNEIQIQINNTSRSTNIDNYLDQINKNKSAQKYEPLTIYDYNVVILISSYERFEMASTLIDQFLNQSTRYKFKIVLLNDGSIDVNYDVFKKYEKIDYHTNVLNN